MILYRCSSCGRKSFVSRRVCPQCLGETFAEVECAGKKEISKTEMTVTPSGFEDRYTLVLGECGGTRVIYRVSSKDQVETGSQQNG